MAVVALPSGRSALVVWRCLEDLEGFLEELWRGQGVGEMAGPGPWCGRRGRVRLGLAGSFPLLWLPLFITPPVPSPCPPPL